jgi:hypothetical protein
MGEKGEKGKASKEQYTGNTKNKGERYVVKNKLRIDKEREVGGRM